MSIGVCYPDKYAVEETFQLLKIPWEWYVAGRQYDAVIARKSDVPEWIGNLVDLTDNDIFSKVAGLLDTGEEHLHEPVCDILLDSLRQKLKKYTLLIEIPPAPWGHPYMVALTHDVDLTSARECRWTTVGYAAYQCLMQGKFAAALRLGLARCGIGPDPWVLFSHWKEFEDSLGVRSTFFFVPKSGEPGVRAHPYRAVSYEVNEKKEILHDLESGGWEIGVHGLDNWTDAGSGTNESTFLKPSAVHPGNRTHWLLFDKNSWKVLDEAGYSYDTTFGYNDDAGFRAGTLQAYQPRDADNLLELPLHIQDLGLFGKSCWAPANDSWKKMPCLHLSEPEAMARCDRILEAAKTYGGAVTTLWHYENLVPPRDWSGFYAGLINRAKADGAWVTTAGEVVRWFKMRRTAGIESGVVDKKTLVIRLNNKDAVLNHQVRVRLHIDPARVCSASTAYTSGNGYVDLMGTADKITVTLA